MLRKRYRSYWTRVSRRWNIPRRLIPQTERRFETGFLKDSKAIGFLLLSSASTKGSIFLHAIPQYSYPAPVLSVNLFNVEGECFVPIRPRRSHSFTTL